MTEKYILTGSVNFGKQYQITDSETNYAYKNNKSDKQKICDLLNKLTNENEQLKHDAIVLIQANRDYRRENEELKQRNDRQYNQLKQLWELIEDEDYNTLRSMLNQRETDEKLLQKEWGTYSD